MQVQTTLTDQELDVLRCIARGLRDKEIATELNMSARMVKYFAQRLHLKIASDFASPRVALVIWAYENGIVTPKGASADLKRTVE